MIGNFFITMNLTVLFIQANVHHIIYFLLRVLMAWCSRSSSLLVGRGQQILHLLEFILICMALVLGFVIFLSHCA